MQVNQQGNSASTFTVAYEGDALLNNTIRARDLAPALLAMDDLLQRSNFLVNGDDTSASLNVRANRQGSYEIEFVLEVAPVAVGMLLGGGLASAANLVRLLFGSQHTGLFPLLKFLRGRRPNVVSGEGDRIIIEADDIIDGITTHRRVEASGNALRLLQDPEVRRSAFGILEPLNRSGIDQVAIREGDEELERVTEEELSFFEFRNYMSGPGRDGKQDFQTLVARDDRATGLRTHKRERRLARASLKSGDGESLRCGKSRRYSDRYGDYLL